MRGVTPSQPPPSQGEEHTEFGLCHLTAGNLPPSGLPPSQGEEHTEFGLRH